MTQITPISRMVHRYTKLPTGNLLLVRALNQQDECIATGIFPALNDTMFFWCGASWRDFQILRPNEAIQWFAMRYWKEKGITRYDMGGGGGGGYKKKYGGQPICIPWMRKSKYQVIENLRNLAKRIVRLRQVASGLGKY